MKKVFFPICFLLVVLVFTGVSCKSTPEPEPKPAQTTDEAQPVADTSDAAKRAADARQRAIDFECPAYFPSEWELAETRYDAVKFQPVNAMSETVYKTAADEYDALFKKAVPLYAQAREDEILAIRNELLASGITRILPNYLQEPDKIALEAQALYEAEDYYKARDTAVLALNEYESLQIGARVYRTRQEIIDREFVMYDQENFDNADEIAQSAVNAYEAGDKKTAAAQAEEALLRYNVILQNSWPSYAAVRRDNAASERETALSNKVNIAVRDIYRDADALYSQAEESYAAENFGEAAILFIDAEALFAVAIQETEEKRQKALQAIRAAEEKIEESVETAIEAERLIEGGSR